MKFTKSILAFIAAVAVAYLLISIMGTQFVLADVETYGLVVSLTDRLAATLHDIYGLVPVLLILVSTTFFIAFIIASICKQFIGGQRRYWFLVAGFVSLPVTMKLVKLAMGVTPFAMAGTAFGLLLIALSGLAGSWVYVRLSQVQEN